MPTDAELGSQPTLSPLVTSVTQEDLHRIWQWFVDLYIRHNWKHKPRRIIIDADSPVDPIYWDQQLTFFHGYYDQKIYVPSFVGRCGRYW